MGHIDDYLAQHPGPTGDAIAAAYALAREMAPEAEDALKYGMPALAIGGKGLISVMETRKHIGVYPYSGAVVAAVGDVPGLIGATKGSMHFALNQPIPTDALATVLRARLDELGV